MPINELEWDHGGAFTEVPNAEAKLKFVVLGGETKSAKSGLAHCLWHSLICRDSGRRRLAQNLGHGVDVGFNANIIIHSCLNSPPPKMI